MILSFLIIKMKNNMSSACVGVVNSSQTIHTLILVWSASPNKNTSMVHNANLDDLFNLLEFNGKSITCGTKLKDVTSRIFAMCDSALVFERRRCSTNAFSQSCSNCSSYKQSTTSSVCFMHPIWPDEWFCNACRIKTRCVVCERRLANNGFHLHKTSQIGFFQKKRLGTFPNREPFYICGECYASGIATDSNNLQHEINEILLFLKTDENIQIQFDPFFSVSHIQSQATSQDKHNSISAPDSIPVFLVDIHSLSRKQFNKHLTGKASSAEVLPNQWKENIVFGRFETMVSTSYTTCNDTIPFSIQKIYDNPLYQMNPESFASLGMMCSTFPEFPQIFTSFFKFFKQSYNKMRIFFYTYLFFLRKTLSLPYRNASSESSVGKNFSSATRFVSLPQIDYNSSKQDLIFVNNKLPFSQTILGTTTKIQHTVKAPDPYKHRLKKISVVNHLPYDIFASTFVHELTHAFIFLTGERLPLTYEEGLCNALCVYYVFRKSECYRRWIHEIDLFHLNHRHCKRKGLQCIQQTFIYPIFEKLFCCQLNPLGLMFTKTTDAPHFLNCKDNALHSFRQISVQHIDCVVLIEIIRERLILKQRLCVYRFKRILFSDTKEYLAATYIFLALLHHGFHDVLKILTC